jgi:hypothetical protein
VTTDRCPACNAAVPADAPWCTLCYAVLRVPETVPAAAATVETTPAPVARPTLQTPLAPDPILDAPISQAAPVARLAAQGWPCLGCGALVPLADNACSQCGRPFLPTDEMPSLALPGVGDLSRMERGQKIVVSVVLGLVVTGLLVAVAFIAGSVL